MNQGHLWGLWMIAFGFYMILRWHLFADAPRPEGLDWESAYCFFSGWALSLFLPSNSRARRDP